MEKKETHAKADHYTISEHWDKENILKVFKDRS